MFSTANQEIQAGQSPGKKGKCSWLPPGTLGDSSQIKDVNRSPDTPHRDPTATPGVELHLHENSFVTVWKFVRPQLASQWYLSKLV